MDGALYDDTCIRDVGVTIPHCGLNHIFQEISEGNNKDIELVVSARNRNVTRALIQNRKRMVLIHICEFQSNMLVPSFNLNRRWRSVCSEHVHAVCAVAGSAFANPCTVHHPQKPALQECNQSLTHSLACPLQLAMWHLRARQFHTQRLFQRRHMANCKGQASE